MKRFTAVLLALLLTAMLVIFSISFVCRQLILPAMNEKGAQISDDVIREELLLARERVTELAELYGIEAEPAISVISEDTLRDLHRQASEWWRDLLQEGRVGNEPTWSTDDLEKVLAADAKLNSLEDREQAEYIMAASADSIRGSIVRMVLPMRLQTTRLGMQEIGKRVDILSVIHFLMGLPWAALALCALLAGLIALLESRKFRGSLRYIGSAMGAAALVLIMMIILYLNAGILPMVQEASAGLAIQYRSMASGGMIRTGILIAVMATGCVLCLIRSRKSRMTV